MPTKLTDDPDDSKKYDFTDDDMFERVASVKRIRRNNCYEND